MGVGKEGDMGNSFSMQQDQLISLSSSTAAVAMVTGFSASLFQLLRGILSSSSCSGFCVQITVEMRKKKKSYFRGRFSYRVLVIKSGKNGSALPDSLETWQIDTLDKENAKNIK